MQRTLYRQADEPDLDLKDPEFTTGGVMNTGSMQILALPQQTRNHRKIFTNGYDRHGGNASASELKLREQ